LLVAGCSSDRTGPGPAALLDFQPGANVVVRWKQDVGSAGLGVLRPAVTREGVYAANGKGRLSRFDRVSGERSWRIETGFDISGGVGAGEGLVLVGGIKGELAAFEEETGKQRWQVKVSSEVLSAPQIADGVVVVRTGDGRITAVNAKDGNRLWLYERATPTLVVRNYSGVTIQGSRVYAGFAAGKLAAISLSKGNIIWETSISQPRGNTELERISDITSLPVALDGQVCTVAFQGRIACLDDAQGSTQWSRDLSSDKGMSVFRGNLYLTDATGAVIALDRTSGSSLWKNEQLLRRVTTSPYVMDNFVIVGDFEGYLHVLKREDGSLLARYKTDSSAILIAPVLLGDGMLVQTTDGMLYSFAIN
jgi:outer membrane protein assembly factor BamB